MLMRSRTGGRRFGRKAPEFVWDVLIQWKINRNIMMQEGYDASSESVLVMRSMDELMLSTNWCSHSEPGCLLLWCFHTWARQRQDNKTHVEPVHSYDVFHTRSNMSGVKGIIGMHKFNICLVVVFLWCENTISLSYGAVPYLPLILARWERWKCRLDMTNIEILYSRRL